MPPVVVRHEGGMRFVADVRGHRVETDQPTHAGGEDSAPMPLELVGVALSTCVALYVQRFCEVRGIPTEGLRVELDTTGAANPNRIGRFGLRVVLPAELPEGYGAALERVARSCAVHNTLMHAPTVEVSVAAGEAAGARA